MIEFHVRDGVAAVGRTAAQIGDGEAAINIRRDPILRPVAGENRNVAADPPVDGVAACAAGQKIVVDASQQKVIALAPFEDIVAASAGKLVIAVATVENVVAGFPVELVISARAGVVAKEYVVARAA